VRKKEEQSEDIEGIELAVMEICYSTPRSVIILSNSTQFCRNTDTPRQGANSVDRGKL